MDNRRKSMLIMGGSQTMLCSMPFRFDSYVGCTHGCVYCFATKVNKREKTKGEKGNFFKLVENADEKQLENFLKNPKLESYLEGTPIHWGGMSDGFQPIEKEQQVSYRCLQLFAKYQYPVFISTNGIEIISSDKYIKILKKCKVVVQISIISKETKKWEPGTAEYKVRLVGIKKLIKNGIKVIVRNQPYMVHYQSSILEMIKELKGIDGLVVEGLKDRTKLVDGMVRVGGEYVYPIDVLFEKYNEIKKECKKNNIRFFVGENRLRWMGEDVNCCGVAHIEGFESSNKLNITQMFFYKYITFSNIKAYDGKNVQGIYQSTKQHMALRKLTEQGDENKKLYEFLKYYVNHGVFAETYELEAIGKDKNGNYVFEFKDKNIERYRKRMFKDKV